jgi:hypothetical protein
VLGRSFEFLLLRRVSIKFPGYSWAKSYNGRRGDLWIEPRYIRRLEYPTAVPRAIGSKIDAAGLENTTAGRVREGI